MFNVVVMPTGWIALGVFTLAYILYNWFGKRVNKLVDKETDELIIEECDAFLNNKGPVDADGKVGNFLTTEGGCGWEGT